MGRDPSDTEKQLGVTETAMFLRKLLNINPTTQAIKNLRSTIMENKRLEGMARERKEAANKRAANVRRIRARSPRKKI